MRNHPLDVLTVGMTVMAIGAVFVLVRRQYFTPITPNQSPMTPVLVSDWREFSESGQRIGPKDAPVTIVEFADYQCPYCARFAESFRIVAKKYSNQVSLVYRHFPMLSIHPYAVEAARASVCAGRQGTFEGFYDFVYEHQDSIGAITWEETAERVGIPDVAAFSDCLQGGSAALDLARDSSAADELGVKGTPTVLVNNMKIPGNPGTKGLDSLVAIALAEANEDAGGQ